MGAQAKHTPTPYKACKAHEGFNGPYFDIEPEDQAEYDAKPYTSIESAEGIVCNAHDLFTFKPGDAEFIVKACNSYEELVDALSRLLHYTDRLDPSALTIEQLADYDDDTEAARLLIANLQNT